MSLYHQAECGHSVQFGEKCRQCEWAQIQAEKAVYREAIELLRKALEHIHRPIALDDSLLNRPMNDQATAGEALVRLDELLGDLK